MSARTKARKRALDIVFEADQRAVSPADVLAERERSADPVVPEHASALVDALVTHQAHVDEVIGTYAVGWQLDRMPAVDRALLRTAVTELLYFPDVPAAVVLDEAVELAKQLSTDESPSFVNGLLAQVVPLRSAAAADGTVGD